MIPKPYIKHKQRSGAGKKSRSRAPQTNRRQENRGQENRRQTKQERRAHTTTHKKKFRVKRSSARVAQKSPPRSPYKGRSRRNKGRK